MSTQNTRFTGPTTNDALFADRMKFWGSFTGATKGAVIFMVILLALMGLFLT